VAPQKGGGRRISSTKLITQMRRSSRGEKFFDQGEIRNSLSERGSKRWRGGFSLFKGGSRNGTKNAYEEAGGQTQREKVNVNAPGTATRSGGKKKALILVNRQQTRTGRWKKDFSQTEEKEEAGPYCRQRVAEETFRSLTRNPSPRNKVKKSRDGNGRVRRGLPSHQKPQREENQ